MDPAKATSIIGSIDAFEQNLHEIATSGMAPNTVLTWAGGKIKGRGILGGLGAKTIGALRDWDGSFREALQAYKTLKIASVPLAARTAVMQGLEDTIDKFSQKAHGRITKESIILLHAGILQIKLGTWAAQRIPSDAPLPPAVPSPADRQSHWLPDLEDGELPAIELSEKKSAKRPAPHSTLNPIQEPIGEKPRAPASTASNCSSGTTAPFAEDDDNLTLDDDDDDASAHPTNALPGENFSQLPPEVTGGEKIDG